MERRGALVSAQARHACRPLPCADLVLLQALEEGLLHLCGVHGLLGVCWVRGHADDQLLLLALGGGVEGQHVLPAQGLGAQRLDLLHVLHLHAQGHTTAQQEQGEMRDGMQELQHNGLTASTVWQ